jgi:hypothetical protein
MCSVVQPKQRATRHCAADGGGKNDLLQVSQRRRTCFLKSGPAAFWLARATQALNQPAATTPIGKQRTSQSIALDRMALGFESHELHE